MGANDMPDKFKVWRHVSIHAPVMGANDDWQEYKSRALVSIHAPVMGANNLVITTDAAQLFQSTHPWWVRI